MEPQAPPSWLEERFPRHVWASFRRCLLRVDSELGAGLDMESSSLGYHVDAVAARPGQDAALRPGVTIVSVGGARLLGLAEGEVDEVFGAHFAHGAELLVFGTDELREAAVEQGANEDDAAPGGRTKERPEDSANYELLRREKSSSEYHAVVRIPVGRGTAWRLDAATAAALEADLGELGRRFGLLVAAQRTEEGDVRCVVLDGLSTSIASARPEAVQILNFYRDGRLAADGVAQEGWHGAGAQGSGGEVGDGRLEVPPHVEDLRQFQYHDHTADIIVHAWGKTLAEAFAQVCVGMFNYMTPLDGIDLVRAVDVEAKGHDLLDLLYHLLDEFLFVFGSEMHVSRRVEILEFDEVGFRIRARGYGESMDLQKHEQGTEIKAITMHMMKILSLETVLSENGTFARADLALGEQAHEGFPHEAYVLLDI